jgi:hypothetical protein
LIKGLRSSKRIDGPLDKAGFQLTNNNGGLSLGENDHTLYVADHWNFAVRKIDLKAGLVTTVAGVAKGNDRHRRWNRNNDGRALTHVSFNSGCGYVCWDPLHRALYVGGPDEARFRWLKDGEVRTVIGRRAHGSGNAHRWPSEELDVPAKDVIMVWNRVLAVDHLGRAYLAASSHPHGLWRAYKRTESGQ